MIKCEFCEKEYQEKDILIHADFACRNRPNRNLLGLQVNHTPKWLLDFIEKKDTNSEFPIREILTNSCYYPASGLDKSPIISFDRHIHSFIYCDYDIDKETFKKELEPPTFTNYKLIFMRDINQDEFNVNPLIIKPPRNLYGDMERYKRILRNSKPHAVWTIWESLKLNEEKIKNYFSLLFIAGEGIATFQALYKNNDIAPYALAIIQPGHGFGGNWTNFHSANGPLLSEIREIGLPKLLLQGYYGNMNSRIPKETELENYLWAIRHLIRDPDMDSISLSFFKLYHKDSIPDNFRLTRWNKDAGERIIDYFIHRD